MKKLKLPRRTSRIYKYIYASGVTAGYRQGTERTQQTTDKVIVQNDVELARQKAEVLRIAGQSIQSLANLGEAYARIIMYGSDQRYPKKNERQGY